MPGLSNMSRAEIFAGIFGGFQRNLYLRLLGGASATPGLCVNDDGTLPGALTEITTAQLVLGTRWADPVVGTPTTIQVPKVGGAAINFTNSGSTWVNVCAYAWTNDANPIGPLNYVAGNPLTYYNETTGTYQAGVKNVLLGQTVSFDAGVVPSNAIVERLGDPPPTTNPT